MIGHLRPISNFEELEKLPHLRKVFDSTVPPVVIFPVSHAVGLSVTRCLEKENVPILALDFKPRSAGLFSRRVSSVLIPEMYSSPDRFEEWMLRIGSLFRERPVLFLVDDEDLFLSLKHADRWQKYYRLPLSPWKVVSGIVNKAKFYRALKKANFPVPETWDTSSLARLKAQKAKIRFPCILL